MADKIFHPDRVIYIDNVPHPIEGSVRPTRMGFECPLLPGDNPQEFFDWAENEVKQWADARVKRVMATSGINATISKELPVIDLSDDKVAIAIENAQSMDELGQVKLDFVLKEKHLTLYKDRLKQLKK